MTQITSSLRDENGFLKDRVYVKNDDGSVNWRKMIDAQYLYPREGRDREQIEARFGRKFEQLTEDEIAKIDDRQLLITLAGINNLAWLRGIKSSVPQPPVVTANEVTSVWVVEFIPNAEDPYGLTVAGQASASLYSVSGRFQLHLAALAGNRSYVRAVRQALRIEILGKDEFDPEASAAYEKSLKENGGKSPIAVAPIPEAAPQASSGLAAISPQDRLAERCRELGYSIEQIKASAQKVRAEMVDNPVSAQVTRINGDPGLWESFANIESLDCFTLLAKINTAAESKKTKKGK